MIYMTLIISKRIYVKNLECILSFKPFYLVMASKNHKYIITEFTYKFLYIISISTYTDYFKFVSCNNKMQNHWHVCNFLKNNKMFHTKFKSIFMTYFHTQFHVVALIKH
jgi:hypothetical protein